MVYTILVISYIFEIAESYLAADIETMGSISISPLQITYAWISLLHIVALITFVRIAEFYDKTGTQHSGFILIQNDVILRKTYLISAYLYISLLSQASVFIIKIYKIILLMETLDMNDLRPFLIGLSVILLIFLVFIDSYTIYFEVSHHLNFVVNRKYENIQK